MVAEWCEEAITALSALSGATPIVPFAGDTRESSG
jgi:hypothetical protein